MGMKSLALTLLLGSLLCAQEPSSKGVNFYSLAKEQELGRNQAAKLQGTLTVVHEAALDAYVAKLATALSPNAKSPFRFTFTIYEDRRGGERAGEPIALPGGPIFVPLSLLAEAPNEAVLAFQLAQAMAHIASRHATRLATKTELMQISLETAPNADLSDRQAQAIPMGALAFQRAAGREADFLAVQIVARVGYNPAAMAAWLDGQPAPRERAVLSAHVPPAERAKAIRAEIEKILPDAVYTASTGSFAEAQALAAAVR